MPSQGGALKGISGCVGVSLEQIVPVANGLGFERGREQQAKGDEEQEN